jgi:putative SOS response-associated peptidase YedK
MPVILPSGAYDVWLDPKTPGAAAQALIRPYDGAMRAYPVSTYVNAPRNEGAACSAPLA